MAVPQKKNGAISNRKGIERLVSKFCNGVRLLENQYWTPPETVLEARLRRASTLIAGEVYWEQVRNNGLHDISLGVASNT
jgi:hypothetical protein